MELNAIWDWEKQKLTADIDLRQLHLEQGALGDAHDKRRHGGDLSTAEANINKQHFTSIRKVPFQRQLNSRLDMLKKGSEPAALPQLALAVSRDNDDLEALVRLADARSRVPEVNDRHIDLRDEGSDLFEHRGDAQRVDARAVAGGAVELGLGEADHANAQAVAFDNPRPGGGGEIFAGAEAAPLMLFETIEGSRKPRGAAVEGVVVGEVEAVEPASTKRGAGAGVALEHAARGVERLVPDQGRLEVGDREVSFEQTADRRDRVFAACERFACVVDERQVAHERDAGGRPARIRRRADAQAQGGGFRGCGGFF